MSDQKVRKRGMKVIKIYICLYAMCRKSSTFAVETKDMAKRYTSLVRHFFTKKQASSCVCEKKVVSLQRPIEWQGVYIDNPSVFSRVNLVNLRYEKLMRRVEP